KRSGPCVRRRRACAGRRHPPPGRAARSLGRGDVVGRRRGKKPDRTHLWCLVRVGSAPGRNRTCCLSVRSRTLCPVSYRRDRSSPVYTPAPVVRFVSAMLVFLL